MTACPFHLKKSSYSKFLTIKNWAKRQGVDYNLAKWYQAAAKAAQKAYRAESRRRGTDFSFSYVDIRAYERMPGYDLSDFLQAKALEFEQKAANPALDINIKDEQYTNNLLHAVRDMAELDDEEVDALEEFLYTADEIKRSRFIQALENKGGIKALYTDKYTDIAFDFSALTTTMKEFGVV